MRWFLSLLVVVAVGCSNKSETGESCAAAEDCEVGECVVGGSFPEGTCSESCAEDADCPDGFHCISRSSGICLMACGSDSECEDARGPDWQCREESLEDGDGNVDVCIGD